MCICSKSVIIITVSKEIAIWGDGVFGRLYNTQLNNDGLMWALVKEKPEEGLWMKRVPIPEVGPNDVKIKIHKTAICGTDVHIYQWNDWAQHTIPIGLTAGHEYVGEIVEVGDGVQGFKIGDLVSGEGHITCGKCRNCLEGIRKTARMQRRGR